jgi:hypothetical protein
VRTILEAAKQRWETHWPTFRDTRRRHAQWRKVDGPFDGVLPTLIDAEVAHVDEQSRAEFDRLGKERADDLVNSRYRAFAASMPALAFDFAMFAEETPAIVAMRAFHLDGTSSIAVVTGRPGVGKTVAVIWSAWHYGESFEPPWFVTGAALARSSRYDADRRRLLAAPSLILDDLGVENSPADIDELVDAFYSEQRELWITTNLAPAAFAEKYGERVVDRLRETGRFIPITGASMRGMP